MHAPKHGEDIVTDKFFTQVIDKDIFDPKLLSLAASGLQLLTLATTLCGNCTVNTLCYPPGPGLR